jgi:putative peptidoglycan lipid II flippase
MRGRAFLNTLIVAGGYLLSRVLGLAREVVISSQFGTSPALDAYRAAFTIPDLIYLVAAGGALGSAFIPVFAGFLTQGDEEAAWRLASGVLQLALLGLLASCALVWLCAEPLVALTVARGFDAAGQQQTADLMRLLLIQPVLLGVGALAKAALESFDRFALPAIGANLYNLGIIGGALLLAPTLGIAGLVWGVNIGAALFLLVQIPGLRGIGARFVTSRQGDKETGVAQVLRLLGPRLIGQSVWQVNFVAVASYASLLGAGAVAANTYAFQLMVLPHGLIALSLGTVIFPQLARLHAAGETDALRAMAAQALRAVLFLALPASALLALLALPLVRALFQRGAFDASSAALTAQALVGYAAGLWAFAAAEIPVRTFYAVQDTRTPVAVACLAVLLNLVLGWTAVASGAGVAGLGLAFGVANSFEALTLTALLARRLGGLGAGFWRAVGGIALGTLALSGTLAVLLIVSERALAFTRMGDTYRWPADFLPLAGWLGAVGGLSFAAYLGVTARLRLEELEVLLTRVRRRTIRELR